MGMLRSNRVSAAGWPTSDPRTSSWSPGTVPVRVVQVTILGPIVRAELEAPGTAEPVQAQLSRARARELQLRPSAEVFMRAHPGAGVRARGARSGLSGPEVGALRGLGSAGRQR